jgi:Mrp family chromosome partitioning ATPase
MIATGPVALSHHGLAEDPLDPNDRDSLSADGLIRFFRRSWRVCLVWILTGLGGGVAFMLYSPAYYTAFATILLEDVSLKVPTEQIGATVAVDPNYGDSQIQVLQSDEVVGRVVDQNRLTEDEEFGKAARGFAFTASPPEGVKSTLRYATGMRVKRALSIRRLGLSNAVEIGFTANSPVRAAAIANAIAQSYIDSQFELKQKAREEAASYLRHHLAEVRNQAFATDPPMPNIAPITSEAGAARWARIREHQNTTETYRALYNSLLQRRYAESADLFSMSSARVITPAEPPSEKSWPRALFVLAIAVMGGAATGIGHALARQVTDHSLRTVDDVQRSTSLDRIASFPRSTRRALHVKRWSKGGLQQAYEAASAKLHNTMSKVAVRLQGEHSQQSRSVIGVVAPTSGAGVSMVAAHLAKTIADSGRRTLLVDANWRKPPTARAMLNSEPARKLARTLKTIELEAGSLDVLVLRATSSMSELNASLSIVTTLQHLKTEYDSVVVDFHSIDQTADLEASTAVLTNVIIVVEARRTSSESIRWLLRLVDRDKVAAIVLNKA